MPTTIRTSAALTLSLICLALASCGFNDELTTRGFIKNGDQICADTLVKTGLGFNSSTSQPDFLRSLGNAYGDAASRFRRLDVRSDDDGMRDSIVAHFGLFSRRLEAGANGTGDRADVRRVFAEGAIFENRLQDYGFATCGGGGAG
jgi:hypothetical protein